MEDFKVALGRVRPSIQRDVLVQEEKKDWKDIGGLEDVKKVYMYDGMKFFLLLLTILGS